MAIPIKLHISLVYEVVLRAREIMYFFPLPASIHPEFSTNRYVTIYQVLQVTIPYVENRLQQVCCCQ